MASRDKKSSVGRKQATTASPQITPAREESDAGKGEKPSEERRKKSGQRKREPTAASKGAKRTITLKAKSRAKISKTKLLAKGTKRNPVQKKATLIKNGAVASAAVIRKRPLSLRERIIPPTPKDATVSVNDRQKRRIKQEPVDPDEAQPPASKTATAKGNRRMKKVKEPENDSILEDVEIKTEPEEEDVPMPTVEQPGNKDTTKKGRPSKKGKVSAVDDILLRSEEVKGDKDIADYASLLDVDVSDSNVIDCLNLDVTKVTKKTEVPRRHSVAKFPVTLTDFKVHDKSALIVNLPKTGTVKALKRPARPRPNSESKAKPSPQSDRSDSPMRILRNGKTRRLQQFPLFDGLDSEYKMRRRLASDFSGSEISKLSGYESDSSISCTLLETAAATEESKEKEQEVEPTKDALEADKDKEKELQLKKEILETLENNQPDTEEGKQIVENVSAAIKRSLSMEASSATSAPTPQEIERDTNANLTAKSEPTTPVKTDFVADVPKLLGIMKQAFNDKGVTISEEIPEVARRKTRSSTKKPKSPEKESPPKEPPPQLPATTISTLTAVGIALGPDITVTAEEVQQEEVITEKIKEVEQPPEPESEPEPVSVPVPVPMEQDTVEDAEAELLDILAQKDLKPKTPQSTPSTSVNGGSPVHENKGSSPSVDDTPESLAEKSQILKALGLQTLQEAEEARSKKQVPKADNYTGTLKTVIKLNRCAEKKKSTRNPIKMTLQKKGRSSGNKDNTDKVDEDEYKIMNEGTSWKHHGGQSSDTAGAQRKSHYSNRSNMDGSSEHTSDGDTNQNEEGAAPGKLLVIPEKASSFSIHPGRLCKDECSYCFGKFGLFDTPCHIAAVKAVDRQDKILANEKHLTRDSCLCDACYRHVDRKVNIAYMSKSVKRNALIAPAPRENHCYVLGCNEVASNILKRKWLIKMRKAVCQVINIDLDNPGLHSIPTCKEHYAAVEHLMVCMMCKRRLARNHIHYLGADFNKLQIDLNRMCIPVKLTEKPVVCKLCRYFAMLVMRNIDDMSENAHSFFMNYRKRLLHFHNVEPMEDCEATEPIPAPLKNQDKTDTSGKKRKRRHNHDPPVLEPQVDIHSDEPNDAVPSSESRPDSPSDYTVDYRNLIPNIAIECLNDVEITKKQSQSQSTLSIRRISKAEAQEKKRMRSDIAVQRLGSNPSISIRQMFPGEEDVPMNGNIEFNHVKERTPEGWEKCTSTIQYDSDTKALWQELQKPYGNQSSFLRHLVLLEKYFRNGDLVLSPRASNLSVTYTESVQNRLRAYDNISSAAGSVQPLTMLPFNNTKMSFNTPGEITLVKQADKTSEKIEKMQTSILPVAMSTPNASVVVNNAQLPKNVPLTLAQANTIASASVVPTPVVSHTVPVVTPAPRPQSPVTLPITATPTPPPQPPSVTATVTTVPAPKSKPPGLISLQQASKLPGTASNKPQSQKIKFPITKNWRPKLIPIGPSTKPEKKPGLVQVISGGKPYHITMEDYKKMCAIKRTYDLRQKRLQETMKTGSTANPNSLLKSTANKLKNKSPITSDQEENNSMDGSKFDKVETKGVTITPALPLSVDNKMPMNLPKIPKSLTVIPQTVTISNKTRSRPTSPNQNAKSTKANS